METLNNVYYEVLQSGLIFNQPNTPNKERKPILPGFSSHHSESLSQHLPNVPKRCVVIWGYGSVTDPLLLGEQFSIRVLMSAAHDLASKA